MLRRLWNKCRATVLGPLWLLYHYRYAILAFAIVFGTLYWVIFA